MIHAMSQMLPRIEKLYIACARDRLTRSSPAGQAEAIASHYMSLFNTARDLHELVKMRRYGGRSELDSVIEYLVNDIKRAHRGDFGIELEWPAERFEPGGFVPGIQPITLNSSDSVKD